MTTYGINRRPGEVLGHGKPDWPEDLKTFAERSAYQRGVADARELGATIPIDMILYCPNCGEQHVDSPEQSVDIDGYSPRLDWSNPPHRSHLCRCGCIWRPADVPTNGVASIQTEGKADTWPAYAGEVVAAPAKR